MNNILFKNISQKNKFLEAIASLRLIEIKSDINNNEKELEEYIKICSGILSKAGAAKNYIEEILNINSQILSSSPTKKNELESTKKSMLEEMNCDVSKLDLSVKEDFEFNFNRIKDRIKRMKESEENIKIITDEYPNAESLSKTEILSVYPFDQIYENKEIKEIELEEKELSNDFEIPTIKGKSKLKVIKISKAPDNLLGLVENKRDTEIDLTDFSKNTVADDGFFDGDDSLASSITDVTNDFEKVDLNVDEASNEEYVATDRIEASLPELSEIAEEDLSTINTKNEQINENIIVPSTEEPKIKEDPQVVVEETKEIEKNDILEPSPKAVIVEETMAVQEETPKVISTEPAPVIEDVLFEHILQPGDNLSLIAMAAYDNEDKWYDIYEYNKSVLDSRLSERGIDTLDNIENNDEIFAGINIKIPKQNIKEGSYQLAA